MGAFTMRSLLIILIFGISLVNCRKRVSYVTSTDDFFEVHDVDSDKQIPNYHLAKATFNNKINTTGWAFLELHTAGKFDDEKEAYSAGYLEGVLTADLIWMHWVNTMKDLCKGKKFACVKLEIFLMKNKHWVEKMVEMKSANDAYWYQVKLYLSQLNGLADGYNSVVKDRSRAISRDYMLVFNLQGDLEDLFEMAGEGGVLGKGRCSALIKILPDGSDLYTAQVTWTAYQTMLRIQKKYVLKFKNIPSSNAIIPGHTMSFSSYPGQLQSGDDFYIISSKLVAQETTIGNSNKELWPNVAAIGQVMEFIRTMVANRLADSGETWTTIFKKYNSGTYNNQWMIVDYTKFKPSSDGSTPTIKPGLLWVLEQLPGIVETQDMTDHLKETTYWPSYNLPFFPNIYNLSGNLDMVKMYGEWFTYDKNPRALIFKRDHSKVKNLDDMLALMRYNDFKHDPLSKCDCNPPYSAENSISARNDLNPANGTFPFRALGHRSHGATDAKITDFAMVKAYQFLSVSGPIHNDTRGIPPFRWSETDFESTTPHIGHPDLWMFKPLTYKWEWGRISTNN